MALLIDHESLNIPAGTRNFGPVDVPDGISTLVMRLGRQTTATPSYWAAGVSVSLMASMSTDGGTTWFNWLGFTATGGLIVSPRDGSEAAESIVRRDLPAGTGRKARFILVVSGGTLRSALTVEVS